MKWYLAKIVFRIICGDGDHMAQFDEQLRLISAGDIEAAFLKAIQIGEQEGGSFFNHDQLLVQWQFVNVAELYHLHELGDGAELYSRIQEYDNADHYADTIHIKARQIREQAGILL